MIQLKVAENLKVELINTFALSTFGDNIIEASYFKTVEICNKDINKDQKWFIADLPFVMGSSQFNNSGILDLSGL